MQIKKILKINLFLDFHLGLDGSEITDRAISMAIGRMAKMISQTIAMEEFELEST